jgi:ribosomal protein L4
MIAGQESFDELCCYTLERGDATFIHQHVVDAFTAQHAGERTKPIALVFALVGLYLHVERHFTGKQVQRAHMTLAVREREWPSIVLPVSRGTITAADVLAVPAGAARDNAISDWCRSVWADFVANRQTLVEVLREYGIT